MTPEVSCHEPPLAGDLQAELPRFWEGIFKEEFSFRAVLAGADQGLIGHKIYLRRQPGSGELMGTTHLAYSEPGLQRASAPIIGGLGEVATAAAFRQQGVAAQLCELACDEFSRMGGVALFLGTVNPAAARVYQRLGFRQLAAASLMARINVDESPERFLAGYFPASGAIEVCPGSARSRCHLIPLALSPHDWLVLDANAGLYSTRYTQLGSCMGLFPRYEAVIASEGGGIWFEAWTETGPCLVGLASARLRADGTSQVDGFIHQHFAAAWPQLLAAVIDWSTDRGMDRCIVDICGEDKEKRSCFERLGFAQAGQGAGFEVGGRSIVSHRLQKSL